MTTLTRAWLHSDIYNTWVAYRYLRRIGYGRSRAAVKAVWGWL